MVPLSLRSIIPLVLAAAAMFTAPAGAAAETLQCTINRGNLCFSTGCSNSGKTQRLALNLDAGTYRLCPNRFNDQGCTEAKMQFDIRETAILGISMDGPEISARAIFTNRATGALSTSLLAAGMSGIDFGSCDIPR